MAHSLGAPPQQLANIHDCPPEIILRILELSVESESPQTVYTNNLRRQQLFSLALVAHGWRMQSQMLLWRDMAFDGPTGGVQIADFTSLTTPQLYRTFNLYLNNISLSQIGQILTHLRGVRHLNLTNAQIVPSLFVLPSLNELKSLCLSDVSDDPLSVPAAVRLALRTMIVHPRVDGHSFTSLISSSNLSLTQLTLYLANSGTRLLNALEPAARALESLTLFSNFGAFDDQGALITFYAMLEQLTAVPYDPLLRPLLSSDIRISTLVFRAKGEISEWS
ncbi:hypothetical protein MNV49_005131 [Pseudohyphozyma bogoriensis]|nr:hypothetical protein MNV49_005131 [Pseudohyphozyma bogoriensis]